MSNVPPRPGALPRLEFAIPCRRFDNGEVAPSIEGILEAAELRKPGRFETQMAVKLFAPAGPHVLTVTPVDPKGKADDGSVASVPFTVENAAWGERLAVSLNFPCDLLGWWTFRLALDGLPLGETHLWLQFAE